jgi:peptidoglycan/LPS O-acetylase OafA/YrhL
LVRASSSVSAPAPAANDKARLAALDGIRAFAVCAVLLFHAGVAHVNSGFLGVDVFFVLSGFLITSLLCSEHRKLGTIRLAGFWGARARRLLPGLFVLLLGVAVYAWVLRYSLDTSVIRGDALSTLLYFANWHFIFSNQSYFAESVAPSPLLHMWSLAVEEQYYLVWPFVAILCLRKGPRLLAWVAAGGAVASALLMASMYQAGISTNRLYFGTDTRSQALLVGSALGALASTRDWRVVPSLWASTRNGRLTGFLLAVAGAAGLLWCWNGFQSQEPFLYEGGFLLVALATGAVITNVTSWRTSVLARILSVPPIVYIGRISYGLYIYHWPLFLVIDGARTGLSGVSLLAARLAASFAAAALSFHLVEQPIRTGSLARRWRGFSAATVGALMTAVLLVLTTIPAAYAVPASLSKQPTRLLPTEHQALEAAHAFTTDPIRLLMVGDSVAFTLSLGLRVDSKQKYGVDVIDRGILGCDLDLDTSRLGGVVYVSSPGADCGSWQQVWSRDIARFHPDVVGLLVGRFELADHLYDGTWVHLGDKQWDAQLVGKLDQAVSILSSGGAHVVIFTFPYIDPPLEQPNGGPWPENVPSRVDQWNALLRQVASSDRGTVTLVDLNRILDPDGHYTNTVDGIHVREPTDGIHITTAGGEWLQPQLLPQIAELGLSQRYG